MGVLRIAIDARDPACARGLAQGLTELGPGEEQYLFFSSNEKAAELTPHLPPGGSLLRLSPQMRIQTPWGSVEHGSRRGFRGRLEELGWAVHHELRAPQISDGVLEREGVEVVHFTQEGAFITGIPTLYPPSDLRHIHLPQIFSQRQRAYREAYLRLFCERATAVVAPTTWVKEDLQRHFGVDSGRVYVVPPGAALASARPPADPRTLKRRLRLPESFILCPAAAELHQNHRGLLDGLARASRALGEKPSLVCVGRTDGAVLRSIFRKVRALNLTDQVRFLGPLPAEEVGALYQLARCVVLPSFFESLNPAVWDGFLAGVPVACSNAGSLTAQGGDAVQLFEPSEPEQIAGALKRLWTDAALRAELVERGRASVARFTWLESARRFRALYRRAGGRPLSDEDRALIDGLAPL